MRETCARVLAAALMTGAIATVVWMSALAGTPDETIRPLAAPAAPRELSVTIRVKPAEAPKKRKKKDRRVQATPASADVAAATAVVARPLAAAHPRPAKRPTRHLAATTPKPTATTPTPAPTVAAPVVSAPLVEPLDDHGNGHAYGHDKARGKGHEEHED